jgi:CubicO group peptidase (beta-lactamase class C family)
MRFNFYILITFFTVSILACHSHNEPVTAHPKFNPPIDKTPVKGITYEDTTTPYYQHLIARLDSFYKVQVRHGFNGSVLLGKDGKIFYERYYGYQNRESRLPLQYNSTSQLASTTKTFTGTAILYLHQHHYLNIEDKVKEYLPSFPYEDITLKMLLNHRSGLPDYLKWYDRYVKDTRTPIDNHKILELFARYKPRLDFRSNAAFKYSNSNFCILALVIEAVTDMKYSKFMKKYIFEPLGMKNTFVFDPAEGLPANATISYKYNWVREPIMFADGVYGDKGIYSTVRDMYIWDQSFYQNKLLDNKTLELAYTPCSFEKPGIKNYGLGWRMMCFPSGNKIIYHNGWWHGNNTVFYRFIKENMTFIVLGNKYNMGIYRQTKPLYSIIKNVPVSEGFDDEE